MASAPDALTEMRRMAAQPENFSRAELGAMLAAAVGHIEKQDELLDRVAAGVKSLVSSIEKAEAKKMLAGVQPKGRA